MPEPIPVERKSKALQFLDVAIQRIVSLGEAEPKIATGPNVPLTLREIREEIVKETPLGRYHAERWAKYGEEFYGKRQEAPRSH